MNNLSVRQRKFLTAKDVAEILNINERTVKNLANAWLDTSGQEGIPGVRIGKLWRFDEVVLNQFLDRQAAPPSVRTPEEKRRIRSA